MTPQEAAVRPRVEGHREQEILQATLDVLAEVGYDRLTMDAVAHAAKASKATLYRRWSSKAALVIDAVLAHKGPMTAPDTGSLRQDLIEMHCGLGGITDPKPLAILGSIATAMSLDPEFAEAYRRDFVGPKVAAGRAVFERARARGEVREDLDLGLIGPALAGMVLHRIFLLGESPSAETIASLIDQIILPACRPVDSRTPSTEQPYEEKEKTS
jgi:AcrR family transcriptional regulator